MTLLVHLLQINYIYVLNLETKDSDGGGTATIVCVRRGLWTTGKESTGRGRVGKANLDTQEELGC